MVLFDLAMTLSCLCNKELLPADVNNAMNLACFAVTSCCQWRRQAQGSARQVPILANTSSTQSCIGSNKLLPLTCRDTTEREATCGLLDTGIIAASHSLGWQ